MERTTEQTIELACRYLAGRAPKKRVWCVINSQTGAVMTWSISKAAASKSRRAMGCPWILAKLEPAI